VWRWRQAPGVTLGRPRSVDVGTSHCTINNSTCAFSGRAIRSFCRVVGSSVPGQERTTELPNYFNYLKCTSTKSVGKKFGQTGAPKPPTSSGVLN
jgi:hypothetical protein